MTKTYAETYTMRSRFFVLLGEAGKLLSEAFTQADLENQRDISALAMQALRHSLIEHQRWPVDDVEAALTPRHEAPTYADELVNESLRRRDAEFGRHEAPAAVPADVARLVIAAREVAYGDRHRHGDDVSALDKAAEAFASRVPWEDEPDSHEAPAEGAGERDAAWEWVAGLYPNDAPSDLAYDANEMVGAFVAGATLRARSSAPEAREGEVVVAWACKTCNSPRAVDPCPKCGTALTKPADGWEWPGLPDIDRIRELAREVGYAIGVHGTMERDLDLIAAPWVAEAIGADELAQHIAYGLGGSVVNGDRQDKPCGRWSCNIHTPDWTKLIDLSVMPPHPAAPSADKLRIADGAMHTELMDTIREDLICQHSDAFTEEDRSELIIPSGCTPQSAFVKIDVSALADVALAVLKAEGKS